MPYMLRRATTADTEAVWELIHETIDWLRSVGSDQWATWPSWQGPEGKVTKAIERGHVWLLFDRDALIATVTVEPEGDPDFWTEVELAEPAMYVSKLAVRRSYVGRELGALLLAWSRDLTYRQGRKWTRLDAHRANLRLHDYYRQRGWQYVRDAANPRRASGVLFQRPAAPMPAEIRHLLHEQG